MTYKGHEITAECVTERAEYSLDDNGELYEYLQGIDSDPEISCYGIVDPENGDIIDWVDTLHEAKLYIDDLTAKELVA